MTYCLQSSKFLCIGESKDPTRGGGERGMRHRDISYSDARTFCDIDSEYPEAAFNTVKVGIMMNGLIQMVCLRIFIYDIIIIAIYRLFTRFKHNLMQCTISVDFGYSPVSVYDLHRPWTWSSYLWHGRLVE